ncbi:MAG: protein jag [Spirochaetia bacterium]|nr:protein jag [Spirochaetia bacterium]
MTKEFEGRTEAEAIAKAVEELQIEREDFDVEVLEPVRKGLFKKNVHIRIHYADGGNEAVEAVAAVPAEKKDNEDVPCTVNDDLEKEVITFLTNVLEKMGYQSNVSVDYRKENKLGLKIDSDYSSIIIGRKGKNLDALQLLSNVFAGKIDPDLKIIVDSENYRVRHEEQIVRIAFKTAEQVSHSGRSRLLEPMNPFERRLVHTALNDFEGVTTKSEGDGLYKQIRVIPTK